MSKTGYYSGKNIELSIVIPAYNEEYRITNVLNTYYRYFNKVYRDKFEIIVVCNGCTDRTPTIIKKLIKDGLDISCIEFSQKLGKGGAIIEGFKESSGRYIGFIDADESVTPKDIKKLLDISKEEDYDGVIASRWVKDSRILIKQPFKRRVASRVFNILVRTMFKLNFNDTQCGAKIFKRDVIEEVLNKIKSKGFAFDVELLWNVMKKGYEVKEVGITWKHQEYSKFNFSDIPTMFWDMLKLRFRSIQNDRD